MSAIANVGILAARVDAQPMMFYSGGIFNGTNVNGTKCINNEMFHSVALVGYGNVNGIGYYIMRNSWGRMF